jgi:bacterioferritin-associated ferredoxin
VERACEPVAQAFLRALGVERVGRPADPLGVGILVCRCLGVGDRQVRESIREGARTPEEVGGRCRAGTGCRSCRPDLWALLDEELLPPTAAPREERHPVAQIVWARAARDLRCLGVRLLAVRVQEDAVEIAIEPAWQRPETLDLGAVAIVRHVLRETVGPHVPVRLAAPSARS